MTDLSFEDMDELIGFGKPASKTADWIVDTYIPNAPVSNRLSIERAIAIAIVEARGLNQQPIKRHSLDAELMGLVEKWKGEAGMTAAQQFKLRNTLLRVSGELARVMGKETG